MEIGFLTESNLYIYAIKEFLGLHYIFCQVLATGL